MMVYGMINDNNPNKKKGMYWMGHHRVRGLRFRKTLRPWPVSTSAIDRSPKLYHPFWPSSLLQQLLLQQAPPSGHEHNFMPPLCLLASPPKYDPTKLYPATRWNPPRPCQVADASPRSCQPNFLRSSDKVRWILRLRPLTGEAPIAKPSLSYRGLPGEGPGPASSVLSWRRGQQQPIGSSDKPCQL